MSFISRVDFDGVVERAEAAKQRVKELEQEHLAEHAECVRQHTENERLSERATDEGEKRGS